MPPGDLRLFRNVGLNDSATSLETLSIGEPSLANNGQHIFVTGNKYASKSLDNGASWEHVSPFTTLPSAAGGFCCDQLAIYDHSRDLFIWLLQYNTDGNGENVFRLAIKKGATLQNNTWHWWDIAPRNVNNTWRNEMFDYPDMALSDNYLWVTFNLFAQSWTRAVVLRFRLDDLADEGSLTMGAWSTNQSGSLRLVNGANDAMYWGSHNRGLKNQIRLSRWAEDSNTPTHWNISVPPWNGSRGTYSAPRPDGKDWLRRIDGRITGAWRACDELGFMWTAASRGSKPFPHVRVVRINETTKQVIDHPTIWSKVRAFAYPDVYPNDRGHLGVTMFQGGGDINPSHIVGIRDDHTTNNWDLQATAVSTDMPMFSNRWGDYLSCRRHSPDGLTWIASGYTLQGGNQRRNILPRYVHFGRRRDERAVLRWQNA